MRKCWSDGEFKGLRLSNKDCKVTGSDEFCFRREREEFKYRLFIFKIIIEVNKEG